MISYGTLRIIRLFYFYEKPHDNKYLRIHYKIATISVGFLYSSSLTEYLLSLQNRWLPYSPLLIYLIFVRIGGELIHVHNCFPISSLTYLSILLKLDCCQFVCLFVC